jgi:homoserine O-succinyltransferase
VDVRLGLLNMMPDKALRVTERQFADLCGLPGPDSLVRFGLDTIVRGPDATAHVARHYRPADALATADLDALVISGANVADPRLPAQAFWAPLCAVFATVRHRAIPTLFSCLATHALLEAEHGLVRRPVAPKLSGVFAHRITVPGHALLAGVAAPVPVPHSRHNALSAGQLAGAGYRVLLAADDAGPHMAVSVDGRRLLMQGHPEYEAVSLLKEYKRDLGLWLDGGLDRKPTPPAGYLAPAGLAAIAAWVAAARHAPGPRPAFPEADAARGLRAPWHRPARRIVANWLAACGIGNR